MHAIYVILIGAYICIYYCYHKENNNMDKVYTAILALGIIFPWLYDLLQLVQDGPKVYFSDPWNFVDFLYIYGSIANIILQLTL